MFILHWFFKKFHYKWKYAGLEWIINFLLYSSFQSVFLVVEFIIYSYILTKLHKKQLAVNKMNKQLDQNSTQQGLVRKMQGRAKMIVPTLTILIFILFSILPNYAAAWDWGLTVISIIWFSWLGDRSNHLYI